MLQSYHAVSFVSNLRRAPSTSPPALFRGLGSSSLRFDNAQRLVSPESSDIRTLGMRVRLGDSK